EGADQRRRDRRRDRSRDQAARPPAGIPLGGDQPRRSLHGEPAHDVDEGRHPRSDRPRAQSGGPPTSKMTETNEAYEAYRTPPNAPTRTLAWNVYGKGVENVGRNGRPEEVDVPTPANDQMLVRVDAVGLCFSDVKLIRLGGEHPKLYGQDLATKPTRLGHETAVTVIAVGSELADRFHPGQRLAIQPDIYANGRSTAYGYTIPGGLIGYHVLGPEVLPADDGAYVTDVGDRLGYAETPPTDPWARLEAAST